MNRTLEVCALGFWVSSVAMVSCSSDSGSGSTGVGGNTSSVGTQGGTGAATGGAGGAGNGNGGAGLGGNGGANGQPLHTGEFLLLSLDMGRNEQDLVHQVYAAFYTGDSCQPQTFGDCVVQSTCSSAVSNVSAGTLRVTSPATATLPANDITITPNSDNTYDAAGLAGLFGGNEALHLSASGATVPAFSTDLTAPLVLLIDSPTTDASGFIHASTSDDLVIDFSRGTAGVVLVAENINPTSPNWIACTSKPNATSLTIPKEALAQIEGPIYLVTQSTKQIVAGDFTVTTGILMNAYTPDKQNPVIIEFN